MGMILRLDKGAYLCKIIQEDNKVLRIPPSGATLESGVIGGSFCECIMAILGKLAVGERDYYKLTNLGALLDNRQTSL